MTSNATYHALGLADNFEFTEERNVIVVERTGVRKSMLINQIVGPVLMVIGDSPRRITEKIKFIAGTM